MIPFLNQKKKKKLPHTCVKFVVNFDVSLDLLYFQVDLGTFSIHQFLFLFLKKLVL